jgi:hypothetical protein
MELVNRREILEGFGDGRLMEVIQIVFSIRGVEPLSSVTRDLASFVFNDLQPSLINCGGHLPEKH